MLINASRAAAGIVLVCLVGACSTTQAPVKDGDATLPGQGADSGRTVLYRDSWGIPHIYAPTVAEGLYAQGWAQAQDRPEQLLMNFKMAMGELTEVNGEAGVTTSLVAHMFGHLAGAQASIARMDASERQRLTAFANGITDYFRMHPEDVPGFWRHESVTPEMVEAFGRMFLYNWSIDEALGDLGRGGVAAEFVTQQRASNQFAVSPARSASGHAMLYIDPHLSWWGPSRFWEMRVHAGEWQGSGVSLAGSPYIGLGHNGDLAWAMTTGGPDTADVYRLTLNPENSDQYRYEGTWRDLEAHHVELQFADGGSKRYTWQSSHHGPVVARTDTAAYAARIAYGDDTNRNAAWEALNFARDYRGAVEACATLSMFPQNVMVADTSGNIYYQRTGRVPVRDPAYDWSQPVDGSTRATEWQGVHPASDHLQVLNPPQGYMQNCNIPPDSMMPGSPFTLDAQPAYLFSSRAYGPARDGWINQRGARAIELLAADDSVTTEEMLAYAVDVRPYGVARWLEALRSSGAPASAELQEMLAWDGELHRDSVPALRYAYWRRALAAHEEGAALREAVDDHRAIVENRPPRALSLTEAQRTRLRESWVNALATMRSHFGDTAQPWGKVHRVGRDGKTWPVGGGGGDDLGLTTLRTMGYGDADEQHLRHGLRGQTSTQVVVLSKPIQSWIYLPVGQSDDPASPHYADQAATVFSERRLKPSWWLPEQLAPHIESRTVLVPRL